MMKKLIFIACAGFAMPCYAEEAQLPIRAEIVQCGDMENIEEACAVEVKCCEFVEPAAGEHVCDTAPLEVTESDNGWEVIPNLKCTVNVE